jgi:hypothetical protein
MTLPDDACISLTVFDPLFVTHTFSPSDEILSG